MKKSIFSLSAMFAMAILAVCSTIFTGCYEKSKPEPIVDPVYYIVGTVYNGATSQTLANASIDITGAGTVIEKVVTDGSFKAKVSAAGNYTIKATAPGFLDVNRTVIVLPVGNNQVSFANADIAMFNANSLPVVTPSAVTGAGLSNTQLEGTFGFENIDEIGPAYFTIKEQVPFELDEYTAEPYSLAVPSYSGFIYKGFDVKAIDKDEYFARCVANALAMPCAGYTVDDFIENLQTATLYPTAGNQLIGFIVNYKFAQENFSFNIEGVELSSVVIYQTNVHVLPVQEKILDSHDSHDGHDGHDGHNGHGGSGNAGGGAGDDLV